MLDGYIAKGNPVVREYDGKCYSIQRYQGKHEKEFTVMEVDRNGVENGHAQLFKKGVLQMSWMMKNGKREGSVTVFKDGVVDRVLRWDDLYDIDDHRDDYRLRAIVNDESGKELLEEIVVGSGIVVYRGEFDSDSLEREGFGIEYDDESGVEKQSGYYKNGELIHLCQEFEEATGEEDGGGGRKRKRKRMKMTEYGGERDENNVDDSLNLYPIYIGDYVFDAKQFRFIRSGVGKVLNEYSGICDYIGEWDKDGEQEEEGIEIELYGGWYGEERSGRNYNHSPSVHVRQLERNEAVRRKKEAEAEARKRESLITTFNEQGKEYGIVTRFEDDVVLTLLDSVEELDIGHSSFNEGCDRNLKLKIDFSGQSIIKRIEIGTNCFKNIREFVLNGLSCLESVKIGAECFGISSNERDDGLCRITNCSNLRHLEIGDYCFQDFKSFELYNVDSFQSIQLGSSCFQYADFSLKRT